MNQTYYLYNIYKKKMFKDIRTTYEGFNIIYYTIF